MKVTEIFASIQGESTRQGTPTVFVRLTGCNLACRYCDTQYARAGGAEISVADIVDHADTFGLREVCITGGEPLLQEDTPSLAQMFIDRNYRVSVETNGTIDAAVLPSGVLRIIDIKCPGSGEEGTFNKENLSGKRPGDEFKFVLSNREDFDFACAFAGEHRLADSNTVLLSPVYGVLDPHLLARWILGDMPQARLNLQLHKIIWKDGTEGIRGAKLE